MENKNNFCRENCIALFKYCQSFIVLWQLILKMYLQFLNMRKQNVARKQKDFIYSYLGEKNGLPNSTCTATLKHVLICNFPSQSSGTIYLLIKNHTLHLSFLRGDDIQ